MSLSGFKRWALEHKTVDTVIIALFLAEAVSRFYTNSFETLLNPVLNKILPGSENSEATIMGVKIKIHKFFVGVVQLVLSFYLAFSLRDFLYKNGN